MGIFWGRICVLHIIPLTFHLQLCEVMKLCSAFQTASQLFQRDSFHCLKQVHSNTFSRQFFTSFLFIFFCILSISSNVLENYLWTLKKKWTGYDAFEMAWHWIMWKLWRRQNTPLQFAISLRWIRLNGIGAVLPRWNRSIAISMPFKHCRFGDGSLIFVIFLVSLLSASEQQTSYKNIT